MKIFFGAKNTCSLNYQSLELYGSLYNYAVDDVRDADIIIISETCTSTEKSLKNTLNYIDSLYQQNKEAQFYVTGCITREFKNEKYAQQINNFFRERNIKTFSTFENGKLLETILQSEYDHDCDNFGYAYSAPDGAVIFISNGCLNNCSFCKASYQKLQLKSLDIERLKNLLDYIDELKIGNVFLKGTNISQYGYDLYDEYKLPEIIQYIEKKKNIKSYELVGFAFKDAIQHDFQRILRDSPKLKLIVGSLESGSDRLLELENKGFTSSQFLNFVKNLEDAAFSLSIIAGFPTETIDDVKMTLDVLKKVKKISEVQISRYINSPIVAANKYTQLAPEIIQEHARIYQKTLNKRNVPYKIL